jgi:hypothetical protein
MQIKKLKMEPPGRCWIWHRWVLFDAVFDNGKISDIGKTFYYLCKDCGARYAVQFPGGYQSIDSDWVFGKTKEIGIRP